MAQRPSSKRPSSKPFYITTPIYYVNDKPHMGHAYTSIAADAARRWHQLQGGQAWMLTGTDEHGQKVLESATDRGLSPRAHVDELHVHFKDLLGLIQVENDDFIRTTELRHTEVVRAILQKVYDQGDIYAADYEGWYSTSEERFWTEKDLVDGNCPLSGKPVQWIKEKNYFFKMSRYADQLRAWIDTHPDCIQPQSRQNEVLGYLRGEVGDLCISRPKTRLPWGIELPFDSDYVTYVWFDALINYISGVGYHPDPARREARFDALWPADYHLVGKDILTTHSVYWMTMLFSIGLEPARTLHAHGWWTIEGRKMSKSIGNVVDPTLLVDAYGADTVRYFLLREIPFGGDGDFSHDALMTRYNAELANDLGNLAHRALSMTEKWLGATVPALDPSTDRDHALEALAASTFERFQSEIESLQFSRALEALWELVRAGNKYIDTNEPWRLNREGDTKRLSGVLRRSLELCRVVAVLLSPICPTKSVELLGKLGVTTPDGGVRFHSPGTLDGLIAGTPVEAGAPLFPRMTELPEKVVAARDAALAAADASAHTKPAPPSPAAPSPAAPSPAAPSPAAPASPAASGAAPAPEAKPLISYDDFAKIELKAGKVLDASKHPTADRLLVLTVDVGETQPRTIVAGIAERYRPEDLVGNTVVVVANLKPAKLRGVQSQGMLLAAGGAAIEAMATLTNDVAPGTVIR